MSTELGKISGKYERFDRSNAEVWYENSELFITSFCSGRGNMSIQLTTSYTTDHILLTKAKVKKLADILNKWLEDGSN